MATTICTLDPIVGSRVRSPDSLIVSEPEMSIPSPKTKKFSML